MKNENLTEREKALKYFGYRYENINLALKKQSEGEEEGEGTIQNLHEGILEISKTHTVKVMLSWGGPSDGYKFYFNDCKELDHVSYWYADWGTYTEIDLSKEEQDKITQVYGFFAENCIDEA